MLLGEVRKMNLINIFGRSKRWSSSNSSCIKSKRSKPTESGMGRDLRSGLGSAAGGSVSQIFTGEENYSCLI